MNRRAYLAALGLAATGLAGCASDSRDGAAGTPTATPDATETPTVAATTQYGDVELPLPREELSRGAAKDAIPAITDPVFGADWSGVEVDARGGTAEPRMNDEDRVIGVTREGEARAYPLAILNWHEIVNDEFHGPLLVTFCPLCGSGVTAVRRVDGEPTVFGVSGLLWNSDLVMYDRRTESLWSQILATAVRGPKTGTELELAPSTMTTWGQWKNAHPDTEVLRPPPESGTITGATGRNYAANPYAGYGSSETIGIGENDFDDDRLHPKAQVIGVTHDGTARAYPLDAVSDAGVVNDTVAGLPVVVSHVGDSLFAYDRRVDGGTLTFERAGEERLRAGGSEWDLLTGRAVDGSHEGTTLEQANDRSPMFWFAWADFHPETGIYGQ